MSDFKVIAASIDNKGSGSLGKNSIIIKTGFLSTKEYSFANIISFDKATAEALSKAGITTIQTDIIPSKKENIAFVVKFEDGNTVVGEVSTKAFQAAQAQMVNNELNKTSGVKSVNKGNESKGFLYPILGIAMIVFLFKSCSGNDTDNKVTPIDSERLSNTEIQEPKKIDPKDKIGQYAVEVMKEKDYPKAFKQFGSKYMAQVNKLAPEVAMKVAKNDSCDFVEMVTFSSAKSTKTNKNWFVDCKNKERFYVDESDLKEDKDVLSNNEKGKSYSYSDLTMACIELIESKLNYPSTFDQEVLDTTSGQSATGTFWVKIPFTAKNALGNELPQIAECIDTGKEYKLEYIKNR